MPSFLAMSLPELSAVMIDIFFLSMPMWRSIKGSTPCPMEPKPTMSNLPGNFTYTGYFPFFMQSLFDNQNNKRGLRPLLYTTTGGAFRGRGFADVHNSTSEVTTDTFRAGTVHSVSAL